MSEEKNIIGRQKRSIIRTIHGWIITFINLFKKSELQTWAEREVKLACIDERKASGIDSGWDYGCNCYESALKALKSLNKDRHSGFSIQMTKHILNRLIDWKPLTPVEDTPEMWSNITEERDGETILQHLRMSSLFKYISKDGSIKYHNVNSCYCVDDVTGLIYQSSQISKIIEQMFPITFPYMPDELKVYCQDLLTDSINGDYDTQGIFYILKSNGERIAINRYFKEYLDDWVEIDLEEWCLRSEMDKQRKDLEVNK